MRKGNRKQPLDSASFHGHEDPAAVLELLTKVGDKWSIFLILSLAQLPGGRARLSELERAIPVNVHTSIIELCPEDFYALFGGADVGRLVLSQDSDGGEASAEHADSSAADQQAQLAGGFRIKECQDHHGDADAAHAERHRDAGDFAPGEAGDSRHLQQRLVFWIDAEAGIVNENPGLAGLIQERQCAQPVRVGGADNLLEGIIHGKECIPWERGLMCGLKPRPARQEKQPQFLRLRSG